MLKTREYRHVALFSGNKVFWIQEFSPKKLLTIIFSLTGGNMKKISFYFILVFIFCFTQISIADLNEGLIAYYPFNGNANDESGNGNNGVVHGASLTVDRFGIPNNSYYFDGMDDHIEIGKQVLYDTNFSIMIWIKSGGEQNTYSCPISQGHGHVYGYKGWAFQYGYPNKTDFKFITSIDGYTWLTVDFDIDIEVDLNWNFIAVVKEGAILKTYKNGILQESILLNNEILLGDFNLTIGDDTFNPGRYFNGSIDDIRIFNRALSELEILEVYNESPCSYGPHDQPLTFTRSNGKPSLDSREWDSCGGAGEMIVSINDISSGYIKLNDELIIDAGCFTNCFKHKMKCIIVNVALFEGRNLLEVDLRSKPGSSITIEFNQGR